MEDIRLFNQAWKWLQWKNCYSVARTTVSFSRDKVGIFLERHWPMVCCGCARSGRGLLFLLAHWKTCFVNGFRSFSELGSAALLVIMWSCFLSLTSMSCLLYVLISMVAAVVAVRHLGYAPGLFIVGLFAILILWMYANFWITSTLFIVGGYLFSLNHARLVVIMATIYAIYCVKVHVGWLGIFLSFNLSFLSNDVLKYLLHWCDNLSESTHFEEHKASESFPEDCFPTECEFSSPTEEEEKLHSCKSSHKPAIISFVEKPKECAAKQVVREDASSTIEMERILSCSNHYEALGFLRHKKIDAVSLKKEYRKKAMLVHPDKNMGSPLASESFKKLQCAYEVLSDFVKKKDYDEQLKLEEESKAVLQKSPSTSRQDTAGFVSEESRRIQCTKCGNSHIWVCTNRTKAKARWCQDCRQYHQAKDGDGWVEKGSLMFDCPQKVEIPCAFVCAESKIFDVSEWATCQGMSLRPNTHRPSFHVNMVGPEKSSGQRFNSTRYPWDLDIELMDEEEEFELWLQQARASGRFFETPKRRKTWSPFKLPQKKGKKHWRRSS
ncbi:Molecular chaperone (superfamily) [Olea europaea subsp. europaea]|uniref:Molecular chaperone (Superfamily) n=1 Tax=Olea europaea subsp. europaea TaxID=158383 RepID=A0A8S0T0N8_OLEEU|nr:Molecular chaperone (superfamily) [Olea europaea subsp. europaea]